MKMSLGHEKQVKHTTTTAQDTPLKQSVQVAGSRTGKELSELLRGVETVLPSSRDRLEIQQVSCDSRKVEKGALFFALHGAQADGNAFIQDAVKRGAVAVASEEPAPKEFPRGVVWIQVRETRKALASTAANFFDHPADALQLLAVTGTNGKTTTTSLVDAIIKASGARTGLFGTIAYHTPRGDYPAGNTRCWRRVRTRLRWTGCGGAISKPRCSRISRASTWTITKPLRIISRRKDAYLQVPARARRKSRC